MYQCEFCTLHTKRKHNLKIHMLRKHKNQYIRENEMCSDRIPVIVDQTLNAQVGYGALAASVQNESNKGIYYKFGTNCSKYLFLPVQIFYGK